MKIHVTACLAVSLFVSSTAMAQSLCPLKLRVSEPSEQSIFSNIFPAFMAVGDYDGDSIPDVVVRSKRVYGAEGESDPARRDELTLKKSSDWNPIVQLQVPEIPDYSESESILAADTVKKIRDQNGDGLSDLLVRYSHRRGFTEFFNVIYSASNGAILSIHQLPFFYSSNTWLEHLEQDIDGDGVTEDVSVGESGSSLHIRFRSGLDYDHLYSDFLSIPAYSTLVSVRNVGDINGDYYNDLAIVLRIRDSNDLVLGHSVLFYSFGAAGLFSQIEDARTGNLWLLPHAAGDFNGDGINDVALSEREEGAPQSQLRIVSGAALRQNSFDTIFVPPTSILSAGIVLPTYGQLRANVDFNADGIKDLLVTYMLDNCPTIDSLQGPPICHEFKIFSGRTGQVVGSFSDPYLSGEVSGRGQRQIVNLTQLSDGVALILSSVSDKFASVYKITPAQLIASGLQCVSAPLNDVRNVKNILALIRGDIKYAQLPLIQRFAGRCGQVKKSTCTKESRRYAKIKKARSEITDALKLLLEISQQAVPVGQNPVHLTEASVKQLQTTFARATKLSDRGSVRSARKLWRLFSKKLALLA